MAAFMNAEIFPGAHTSKFLITDILLSFASGYAPLFNVTKFSATYSDLFFVLGVRR